MSSSLLSTVLYQLVRQSSVSFSYAQIVSYPPEQLTALISSGVLVRTGIASSLFCKRCGVSHSIRWLPSNDRDIPYYECEVDGREWPCADNLQIWTATFLSLATALTQSLTGDPKNTTTPDPDIRRLGTALVSGNNRDVFLVRGNGHSSASGAGTFTNAVVIAICDSIAGAGIHDAGAINLASDICKLGDSGPFISLQNISITQSTTNRTTPLPVNGFVKRGDLWHITYAGRTIQLKHTTGMTHIEFLIANQGQDISALHLMYNKDGSLFVRGHPMQAAQLRSDGMGVIMGAIGEGAEKARSAVFKSVERVMSKVKGDHPQLYEHLKAHIALGKDCTYNPKPQVSWTLDEK